MPFVDQELLEQTCMSLVCLFFPNSLFKSSCSESLIFELINSHSLYSYLLILSCIGVVLGQSVFIELVNGVVKILFEISGFPNALKHRTDLPKHFYPLVTLTISG
jgi:hypothetical protein